MVRHIFRSDTTDKALGDKVVVLLYIIANFLDFATNDSFRQINSRTMQAKQRVDGKLY